MRSHISLLSMVSPTPEALPVLHRVPRAATSAPARSSLQIEFQRANKTVYVGGAYVGFVVRVGRRVRGSCDLWLSGAVWLAILRVPRCTVPAINAVCQPRAVRVFAAR